MDSITLSLYGEFRRSNIDEVVRQLQPAIAACLAQDPYEIQLDLRTLGFVTPAGLATLTGILRYLGQCDHIEIVEVLRPLNQDIHDYLTRMEFYDHIQVEVEYPWGRRDPTGRFRELVEITSEEMSQEVARELALILQRGCGFGDTAVRGIQFALSESIDNVFHHADSPINAIVCAQSYPNWDRVELAIVDCGRGFRQSLSNNVFLRGRFDSAVDAIKLALQAGVTGRPDYNAGEGLFIISEYVKLNGGKLIVYSENGLLGIDSDARTWYNEEASNWQGSIISVSMNTNGPTDMRQVYDLLGTEEDDYGLDDVFA